MCHTRNHSSIIRTACLPTISVATRCHYQWGAHMRKFKQVSSLGHQMPLARGLYSELPCPEGVVREGFRIREWSLYGEVNCILCNGHIGTLCGQTGMAENITFPQLRWRVVIRSNVSLSESNSRSVSVFQICGVRFDFSPSTMLCVISYCGKF